MNENPIHILLVEDEEDHAELITRAFKSSPLKTKITLARTLQDAYAGLKDFQPHLMILDYFLPDGKGIDLLKQCGCHGSPCLPILFMTSHVDEKIAVEAMKAGAIDYLIKSEAIYADMPHIAERALREWKHIQERRAAEKALKESEARYRRITEGLSDYQYMVRVENGQAVRTIHSPACEKVTGYTPEEFSANQYLWLQMVAPEDRDMVADSARRILSGENVPCIEHRIIRKDGAISWVRDTIIPQNDASGALLSYDGVIKDITAEKKAEAVMLEKQRLNELLLNSLPHPAMLINKNRTILAANKIALNAGAEIGGRCWETFGHGYFIPDEDKKYIQNHNEAPPCGTHCWFCRADDSLHDKKAVNIDVDSSGSILDTYWVPLNDDQFLHYAIDVTERRRHEDKILEINQQLNLFALATNDMLWNWDIQSGFIERSIGFEKVFGYLKEEIVPNIEWWIERLHPDDHERVMSRYYKAVYMGKTSCSYEYRFRRRDNNYSVISDRAYIVRDNNGKHIRSLGAMTDITERKRLESQLIQSEKLSGIGTFVSGVAHELNNPLTAVLGFSQQLLEREYPLGAMREKLQIIASQSERAVDIVQNLLKFSRKHEPRKAAVSINDCLEGALNLKAYQLKADNIEIRKVYGPDLPRIFGDAHQLQLVFLNIIMNAHYSMKSICKKGVLRMETRQMNEEIVATLENDGPSMPEEGIHKIFDPFYTTKRVGEGVGLGLSISYGIIKDHNGTITAENIGEQGVRFTITIPIAGESESESESESAPAVLSILIVEDEDAIRRWLYEILAAEKFLVLAARDGKEAMEIIKRREFDIIVTDIKMPEMDGLSLAEWLVEEMPEYAGRLIIATGSLDEKYDQFCDAHGCAALRKPFTREQLLETIQAVMKKSWDTDYTDKI